MTLEEAIERLDEEVEQALPDGDSKSLEAVRLGIEALRRINGWRDSGSLLDNILLPGETKK